MSTQPPPAPRSFRVLPYLGLGFLILVVAVLGWVFTRPENLHVERTGLVAAPADVVFPIINDLKRWGEWSPYEHRDPNMKRTWSGPQAGPGAVYGWNGNSDIGEGQMTITDSKPNEKVVIRLQFTRPFACDNTVLFTLAPSEAGTNVTWAMDGKNNFMGKLMSLFINMDEMVGKDFADGIANLDALVKKQKAETPAATASTTAAAATTEPAPRP